MVGLRNETQHVAPKMNKDVGFRPSTQPTDTSGFIFQTHVIVEYFFDRIE